MRISFRAALLLLPILLAIGCSSAEQKKAHLERGNKYYSEGKYKEAIIEHMNVLQIDGNNVDALRKLALSYYSLEDFGNAFHYFAEVRNANPGDLDSRLKLARCCLYFGKVGEARNELNFMLDEDSQRLDALDLLADAAISPDQISGAFDRLKYVDPAGDPQRYNLAFGLLYAKKGDLPNAENYLIESLKGSVKLPEAHLGLGNVAVAKKDFTVAEQEFKAAAELTTEDSTANLRLADFYLFRRNPDHAKQVLENMIQKSPGFAPALQRLAKIALENQKLDECDRYLQTALMTNPSDFEAKTMHAQLLLARNETARAAEELEEIVKVLPDAALPRYLLGFAYMRDGNAVKAKMPLQKAVRLDPNFMPAVLLLADANMRSGDHQSAIDSLLKVTEKDPGNLQACALLAEAAKTSNEIEKAEKLLERSAVFLKDKPKFDVALGLLYLKKGDFGKAEDSVKQALAKEPDSADAHVLMGDCLLRGKDHDRAGQEYKRAAELAPKASMAQIRLAEFCLIDNKVDEAKRILSETAAKSPEFLPASIYLAKIAFAETDFDGSIKLLDGILQKNPDYVDALTLRGQVNLAREKTDEALEDLRQALKINPDSEDARNLTGIAYLKESDFDKARSCFSGLVSLDPDLFPPRVRLAELDIRSGYFQSAIDNLELMLGKGAQEPALYLLLGSAYLGKKDAVKAGAALQKYLAKNPKDVHGKYLYGLALRGQGKQGEAVKYFEDALDASPPIKDSLAQLVSIDIAQNDLDSALNRVKKQIKTSADDAQDYMLLGSVHQMRKEMDQAETAYLKAIEIDPKLVSAHMNLARVYALTKKLDKALARLDQVIKMNHKNTDALMLSGILHQTMNDIPKAQEEYEEVVALNPGFAVAANNLAYIYSEYMGDNDKALRMAEMARESAPNNPDFTDTLGWVLYKQNNLGKALQYLKESSAMQPDNAEILYHLGMTQYKLGYFDEARQSLNRVLEKGGEFKGILEARRVLDEMVKKQ